MHIWKYWSDVTFQLHRAIGNNLTLIDHQFAWTLSHKDHTALTEQCKVLVSGFQAKNNTSSAFNPSRMNYFNQSRKIPMCPTKKAIIEDQFQRENKLIPRVEVQTVEVAGKISAGRERVTVLPLQWVQKIWTQAPEYEVYTGEKRAMSSDTVAA